MDEMCQWMKSIQDRISTLESKFTHSSSSSSPPSTKTISQGNRRLQSVKNRTTQFMAERNDILIFNEKQRRLLRIGDPDNPAISWMSDKGLSYYSVIDTNSLVSLVRSKKGPVGLSLNAAKKYGVLLIDNKLVPLSRDFKDGIGLSYIWTDDDKIKPASPGWAYDNRKKMSKRFTDPRIGIVDPVTGKLWDALENIDEEESECADSDDSWESSDEEMPEVDVETKEVINDILKDVINDVVKDVENFENIENVENSENGDNEEVENVENVENVDNDVEKEVECEFSESEDSGSDSDSDIEDLVESEQDSESECEESKRALEHELDDDDSGDEYRPSKKTKK